MREPVGGDVESTKHKPTTSNQDRDRSRYGSSCLVVCLSLLALSVGPTPYTLQGTRAAVVYGEKTQDAVSLEHGIPADKEIGPAEAHHYSLDLFDGQFIRLLLEKTTADIVLVVSRPNGERITEAKHNRPVEPIGVVIVAKVSGKHSIEVRSLAKAEKPTRYKLSIVESRTATEADRNRVAAAKLYTEGMRLLETGNEKSRRDSIQTFKEAVPLLRAAGDQKDEANTLSQIGYVYQILNQHPEARQSYAEALPLYRAAGDKAGEAVALYNIAASYNSVDDRSKALEYFNQALPVIRAAGNHGLEAGTLDRIGRLYDASGDKQKALGFLKEARVQYRAVGNSPGEASVLYRIGGIHFLLNENQKAIEYLGKALSLYRSAGDRRSEVVTLNGTGRVYHTIGQYQKALDHYLQVISVCDVIRDNALKANALTNAGQLYSELGDYQRALDSYQQALTIHREVKNRRGEATALGNMGSVHIRLKEPLKALEHFNESLALIRDLGDQRSEATLLNGIAAAHVASNQTQKAIELYNQALVLHRQAANRRGEGVVLNNMGRVYFSLGDYRKAIELHNQGLAHLRAVKDHRGEAQLLYNLARSHRALGNLVEARPHIEAAIRSAESLRQEVSNQQLRTSFFALVRDFYDLNIDILMQLHKVNPSKGLDAIAFETSEQARARSLVELLAEARLDIRQGVDTALLERERSLQRLVNTRAERQAQLLSGRHTAEQSAAAAKEVDSVIHEYQQVQAQIRAASPRYAALTQPQPLKLVDIQRQLLDEETLLLEYALGDERSFLWAVSSRKVTSHELPKRAEIEAAARRFYELLQRRDADREGPGGFEEAANQLSQMLFSPLGDRLESRRLVIVADGILHYIPFAALPKAPTAGSTKHSPLIVGHELVMLPSASVLAELRQDLRRRKPGAKSVAVFADPVFGKDDPRLKHANKAPADADKQVAIADLERAMTDLGYAGSGFPRLPFSRREADAIVATAPTGQAAKALDFEASRARALTEDLSQYRIIHFATHGLLNSRRPELSGIVLSLVDSSGQSQDGFLRLHEVYNLRLPVDLVVLSACQTGLGKEIRGEGLVGLTRGFMYAGAGRVVASLWKVDDAATADLMKRFYRGMLAKGLPPAAALREAQVEMSNQARWRSPYYWAAFVLQGEWK